MYNRLILNRTRSVIEFLLRTNQNGFRAKRTTVAEILTLRRIIDGVKECNINAVMAFIDFTKAFDSIHGGKMIRMLKAYGIPPKLEWKRCTQIQRPKLYHSMEKPKV